LRRREFALALNIILYFSKEKSQEKERQ
jgi:hypothetical protein